MHGHLSEGRQRLATALAQGRAVPAALRADALSGAGNLAHSQGETAASRRLHEESLALRRDFGRAGGRAVSLNNLGLVAWAQADYGAARALYQESLALKRGLGNQQGIALSLYNLGNVARAEQDYPAAWALHQESLAILREWTITRASPMRSARWEPRPWI